MRGIHTCCPEPVSTINITQNILQMDGETAFFVDEHFVGSAVSNGILTLSYTPYAAASVQLSLNSGVQRLGVDFIVVGRKVQFISFVPQATDLLHVRYFSSESGAASIVGDTGLATGFTMGYSSPSIPDGWLLMDGVTKVYDLAATEDLYAFLGSNLHLVLASSSDGTGLYRTLKSIQTPYYVDGQIMAGNTIIKI
jgi:hypothetical protein